MSFLAKLFTGQRHQSAAAVEENKRTAIYRSLIRREAEIGGQLFGPVPKGVRREFFCLDKSTWIWHEEWSGKGGQKQIRTTRYDMRPTGVLKAQNGQGYHMVGLEEARHLQAAIREYGRRVNAELYPHAG
jgi:hypothetical protein